MFKPSLILNANFFYKSIFNQLFSSNVDTHIVTEVSNDYDIFKYIISVLFDKQLFDYVDSNNFVIFTTDNDSRFFNRRPLN